MQKRKILITLLVVAALAALAYAQFRTWRHFDWAVFFAQTRGISPLRLLFGLLFIWAGYWIRALRWKIFLRPTKPVQASRLLAPQFIGFAGVVVLGRPGDLIRAYLIARKERLQFSSQLAVLTVERVFDIAAFALILTADMLLGRSLTDLPARYIHAFRMAGFALLGGVLVIAVVLSAIWWNEERAANVAERIFRPLSKDVARSIKEKVHAFGRGLHTIHDFKSFAQILGLSLLLWVTIAFCYLQVTHAYPDPQLQKMAFSQVILIMAASVAGSTLQLPVVGGGQQLGTITVMQKVFSASKELAASCGLMLWLITIVSVLPIGLALARKEHVSLAKISEESREAE